MIIVKKIKIVYENGGFGRIDDFYHETLIIDSKNISYKKEWEINKSRCDCILYAEKKIDFSWKAMVKDSDLVSRVIEEIGDDAYLSYDSFVADDGFIKIVSYYEDGTSKSNSFYYSAYRDMRGNHLELLKTILSKELPIPDFLL